DLLPADIDRRPKRGFALPLVHWLNGDLRSMFLETCAPDTVVGRGLIDPDVVAPLMKSRESIASNLYPRLWSLMVFELWCRAVLDAPAATAAHQSDAQVRGII